jgi:hypothetical protein
VTNFFLSRKEKNMKWQPLSFIVVLFLSFCNESQAITGNPFRGLVLKGGLSVSDLRNVESEVISVNAFGIAKDWTLKKYFTLGTEIMYARRGDMIKNQQIISDLDYSQDLYSYDIYVSVGYLQIPLFLKYHIKKTIGQLIFIAACP